MLIRDLLKYIESLPEDTEVELIVKGQLLTSGQVEALGISRQLLRYYVKNGYVRTVQYGRQHKYYLEDILKVAKK